ncbi:M20/M25/M40 family metallo-hydrolase [Streptomyces sioyaensis]|uniref:M20/M25/M40 family metallo-hydrolase n=1 Tax=Streptomyces sioyaensis TaxID=67364 RepID=UPI0037D48792
MTGSHLSTLAAALDEELPAAAALRHRLHARPCLSGAEAPTRDLVLAALPGGSTTKVADTGAVVRIGGPGPAVAVRAELDALAVQEKTGVPWTSEHPGLMHACGHDVHLAALTALARAIGRKGARPPC